MFLVCNYSVFICYCERSAVPERLRNTAQNSGQRKNEHSLSPPSNNLPAIYLHSSCLSLLLLQVVGLPYTLFCLCSWLVIDIDGGEQLHVHRMRVQADDFSSHCVFILPVRPISLLCG